MAAGNIQSVNWRGIAAIKDLIVGDLVILVLDESVRIEAKLKFKL